MVNATSESQGCCKGVRTFFSGPLKNRLYSTWSWEPYKKPRLSFVEMRIAMLLMLQLWILCVKSTFQQTSLIWPVHLTAQPRHPTSPPVQHKKEKVKRQHIMTFDPPVLRVGWFLSRVVFKQWHLGCSRPTVTSRGPYVLRMAPLCPGPFMHC